MRSDALYLCDMVEAIDQIGRYLKGQDEASFEANAMLHNAVTYQLMIVGEAAAKMSAETRALGSDIPWPLIVGFCNILVHEYFAVSVPRIWAIARQDAPQLGKSLEQLLNTVDAGLARQLTERRSKVT